MANYDPSIGGYIDTIRKSGPYCFRRRWFFWQLVCAEPAFGEFGRWVHVLSQFRTKERAMATAAYMKLTGFEDVTICH